MQMCAPCVLRRSSLNAQCPAATLAPEDDGLPLHCIPSRRRGQAPLWLVDRQTDPRHVQDFKKQLAAAAAAAPPHSDYHTHNRPGKGARPVVLRRDSRERVHYGSTI